MEKLLSVVASNKLVKQPGYCVEPMIETLPVISKSIVSKEPSLYSYFYVVRAKTASRSELMRNTTGTRSIISATGSFIGMNIYEWSIGFSKS